jgi:hypothetical protein
MMNENDGGKIIVDAAVAIHREFRPGLLESVYEGWNIRNRRRGNRVLALLSQFAQKNGYF